MRFYTKLFFILILGLQFNLFSQIPNAGFENWVDPFTPNEWITNNAPPAYTPVYRTSTAAMGTYAVTLQIVNSTFGPIPPFMQTDFFPVSQNHGSLMGYYQFFPVSSTEIIYLAVFMIEDGNIIGGGGLDIGMPASSYTTWNCPITYFGDNSLVADSAYIWIGITDTSESNPPMAGGYANIDQLSFGPPTGVHELSSNIPDNFQLKQNFPNPFNPSTKINFNLADQSYVELIVYDILGNQITKLVSDNYSAGEYSVDFTADNLPAGVYIARFSSGRYSNTIKMTLLK